MRDWEQGHYTASFRDATDLRTRVAQVLHQHLITQAATPLDQDELERQALAPIAPLAYTSGTLQVLSIVRGPSQQVIRPAELESQQLSHYLQDEAHRGPDAVLSHSAARPHRSEGTRSSLPLPCSEPDSCRGAPDRNRTETSSGRQWAFLVETGSKPPCPHLPASGQRCPTKRSVVNHITTVRSNH